MTTKHTDNKTSTKTKYTIKQIFTDNWARFLKDNPHLNIRQVVLDNVDKIIKCQTIKLGYTLHFCEECSKFYYFYHTCKSRFCNSCGVKYAKQRAVSIASKCISCKHRHLVFTIPEELRRFFRKDRSLLNYLFYAASQTLLSWFNDLNKSQNFKPGIISVLHTFGRDLKFNPHIHILCTEGAMGNTQVFRPIKYINYEALRKRFQTILLNVLEQKLGRKSFRDFKNHIYSKTKNGFYVRAKPNEHSSIEDGINYIIRYTGRPVMASSRIIDYDGDFVTFYYERHEDHQRVEEKVHVYDFIKRLIMHIPDYQFKMIRYYGIYAKKHKFHDKIKLLLSKKKSKFLKSLTKWKFSILLDFNRNPLSCPRCGCEMIFMKRSVP